MEFSGSYIKVIWSNQGQTSRKSVSVTTIQAINLERLDLRTSLKGCNMYLLESLKANLQLAFYVTQ